MNETNNNEWFLGFKNNMVAVKEEDAIKTYSTELRRCVNGHKYLFPDIIYPDAGGIFDAGVIGKNRVDPMAACPECRIRV